MKALAIIRSEHLSIAAVLHGMLILAKQIEERGTAPDFNLFGAMIYYIDAFPERFHHPKEDAYLFSALRLRHPEAASLLDQLQSEHAIGARKIRAVEQAMVRYQQGGDAHLGAFLDAIRDYAEFHWKHMRAEENEVLPLAAKYLTAEDWEAIDAAFSDHKDQLLGLESAKEYATLFSRIVNLAPPPIGVGPEPADAPASRAERAGKPSLS
jgi:hemerythrin-like domain-containing protein